MRISPTVRGFLILIAVAAIITAFQLQLALSVVLLVLRVLFLVVIGIVLYTLWRRNRDDISMWQRRSQIVFYGAAALAFVDVAARFVSSFPANGAEALVFFLVLAACAYAMVRVWRNEHTYGY
jgi:ABC-type polysaccharide/polyol phosphate export permease